MHGEYGLLDIQEIIGSLNRDRRTLIDTGRWRSTKAEAVRWSQPAFPLSSQPGAADHAAGSAAALLSILCMLPRRRAALLALRLRSLNAGLATARQRRFYEQLVEKCDDGSVNAAMRKRNTSWRRASASSSSSSTTTTVDTTSQEWQAQPKSFNQRYRQEIAQSKKRY